MYVLIDDAMFVIVMSSNLSPPSSSVKIMSDRDLQLKVNPRGSTSEFRIDAYRFSKTLLPDS